MKKVMSLAVLALLGLVQVINGQVVPLSEAVTVSTNTATLSTKAPIVSTFHHVLNNINK